MAHRWPLVVAILLLFAGGCAGRAARVLGRAPEGHPTPIRAVRQARAGSPVVLAGEMVEKCPVAGCWFQMSDGSGTIRVDTKSAGFVVLDVPLHARVTVSGRVRRAGGEPEVEAAGIRY